MPFNLQEIENNLCTNKLGKSSIPNELWDEIGSTNDRAIELAKDGTGEGVFIIARSQLGGRGRQGRKWVSPPDSGVFMSILLRPKLSPSDLPLISLATGVAVSEALESTCGIKAGLKWVNDIVVAGKKLGGILAEMPGSRRADASEVAAGRTLRGNSVGTKNGEERKILPAAVIVGIGINLFHEKGSLPDELKDRITSVKDHSSIETNANRLVAEILNCLESQYNNLLHGAPEFVLDEWKQRSITLGKRVRATIGDDTIEGNAIDITESGALILQLDSGETEVVHAGEISIRLADGNYA